MCSFNECAAKEPLQCTALFTELFQDSDSLWTLKRRPFETLLRPPAGGRWTRLGGALNRRKSSGKWPQDATKTPVIKKHATRSPMRLQKPMDQIQFINLLCCGICSRDDL